MEMYEKLDGLFYTVWSRLGDAVEDLANIGYETVDANSEYIMAVYEDGDEEVEVKIFLEGTERAFGIKKYEEIYRG